MKHKTEWDKLTREMAQLPAESRRAHFRAAGRRLPVNVLLAWVEEKAMSQAQSLVKVKSYVRAGAVDRPALSENDGLRVVERLAAGRATHAQARVEERLREVKHAVQVAARERGLSKEELAEISPTGLPWGQVHIDILTAWTDPETQVRAHKVRQKCLSYGVTCADEAYAT